MEDSEFYNLNVHNNINTYFLLPVLSITPFSFNRWLKFQHSVFAKEKILTPYVEYIIGQFTKHHSGDAPKYEIKIFLNYTAVLRIRFF